MFILSLVDWNLFFENITSILKAVTSWPFSTVMCLLAAAYLLLGNIAALDWAYSYLIFVTFYATGGLLFISIYLFVPIAILFLLRLLFGAIIKIPSIVDAFFKLMKKVFLAVVAIFALIFFAFFLLFVNMASFSFFSIDSTAIKLTAGGLFLLYAVYCMVKKIRLLP